MGLEIKSFRAAHYNPERFGFDWSSLTCPPYDVIDDRERQNLISLSPYNYVHVILHKPLSENIAHEEKNYEEVRELIDEWKASQVLVEDREERTYLYKQDYDFGGKQRSRYGFICLLKLPEEAGIVLPHEKTHQGPKEDRLALLSKVKAILEPVFFLVPDTDMEILQHLKFGWEKANSIFTSNESNGRHYCCGVSDIEWISELERKMFDKRALIADGHHRYEVAIQYRNLRKARADYDPDAWYNYIMVFFAPMCEDNISILPIHRKVKEMPVRSEDDLVKRVEKFFNAFVCDEKLLERISLGQEGPYTYGIVTNFGKFKIELKPDVDPVELLSQIHDGSEEYKRLHVVVLHKILFPLLGIKEVEGNLLYEKTLEAVLDLKGASAGFVLGPTSLERVYNMAIKGERMPQKSTYFYPKIRSGFVFYDSSQ